MNRSGSVSCVVPVAPGKPERRLRRAVWVTSFFSAFSFLVILVLLPIMPFAAGLAQKSVSNKAASSLVQQPGTTNTEKKKGVTKASSAATNQVTAQTGSQPPAASLTYTITSEPKMPSQGELVKFNLTPTGQTQYAFAFTFLKDGEQDADKKSTKPNELHIEYRFRNSGWHTVSAQATEGGVAVQGVNIESLRINVLKTPLYICGNLLDPSSKPNVYVGQEVSLATADLKGDALRYRFVFDEANASTSAGMTLPANSIQGGNNQSLKGASFVYASPDPRKRVHAEILWTDQAPQWSDTHIISVDPLPKNAVDLTFTPEQPNTHQEITLKASMNPSLPHSSCPFNESKLQYRFEFAGQMLGEWSSKPTADIPSTLSSEGGTYKAKVHVRFSENGELIEKEVNILISRIPEPAPICIPCLITVCLVLNLVCGPLLTFLAYLLIPKPPIPTPQPTPTPQPSVSPSNPPVSPYPTFVFNSGEETASDKAPQLRVNIEIRVNAQASRGEPQLTLNEGRLIKFVRRKHV